MNFCKALYTKTFLSNPLPVYLSNKQAFVFKSKTAKKKFTLAINSSRLKARKNGDASIQQTDM